MVLAGVGSTTFAEVGVVLVLAVIFGLGVAGYLTYVHRHKMLRSEEKEDEREALKQARKRK